jgi:uroporphyrinogen-III synthase
MKLYVTQIEAPRAEVVQLLAERGYSWRHVPLRSVTLLNPTIDSSAFDALILSSHYASRWLVARLPAEERQRLQLYLVGKRTLAVAGMRTLRPGDLGPEPSASALCAAILAHKERRTQRVLFLCGETRLPVLEEQLTPFFSRFQALEVYATLPRPHNDPARAEEIALFFSPSAVEDYHARFGPPPGGSLALGDSTHHMMKLLSWQETRCLRQPDWGSLVEELNKAGGSP